VHLRVQITCQISCNCWCVLHCIQVHHFILHLAGQTNHLISCKSVCLSPLARFDMLEPWDRRLNLPWLLHRSLLQQSGCYRSSPSAVVPCMSAVKEKRWACRGTCVEGHSRLPCLGLTGLGVDLPECWVLDVLELLEGTRTPASIICKGWQVDEVSWQHFHPLCLPASCALDALTFLSIEMPWAAWQRDSAAASGR